MKEGKEMNELKILTNLPDRTSVRKTITLMVTQACNLSCTYCYEENKNCQTMTFETAKEILDKELTVDDGFNDVEIDFFGVH